MCIPMIHGKLIKNIKFLTELNTNNSHTRTYNTSDSPNDLEHNENF